MKLEQGNLTKVDRVARVLFGLLVVLGSLLGLGSLYFLIVGAIAIASGVFSICLIKSFIK